MKVSDVPLTWGEIKSLPKRTQVVLKLLSTSGVMNKWVKELKKEPGEREGLHYFEWTYDLNQANQFLLGGVLCYARDYGYDDFKLDFDVYIVKENGS